MQFPGLEERCPVNIGNQFRQVLLFNHLDSQLIGFFDGLGIESSELKDALKSALLWQIKNMSPSHAINMHVKIKHLFKFLMDQFSDLPAEISEEHLISYGADPMVLKSGYLSGLSGFLKKWHELGYPGVSKGAVDYLKSVRLSGNEKGVAVRTMDPVWGPLTVMETEALLDAQMRIAALGSAPSQP